MDEEPPIDDGMRVLMRGFSDLSTERQIGMGVGPIPWSAMLKWCEVHRIYDDARDHAIAVWRSVDVMVLASNRTQSRGKKQPPLK